MGWTGKKKRSIVVAFDPKKKIYIVYMTNFVFSHPHIHLCQNTLTRVSKFADNYITVLNKYIDFIDIF